MGKKAMKKKVENDSSDDEVDAELEAEMKVLSEIQNEKKRKNNDENDENEENIQTKKTTYNKEGLLNALETIPCHSLDFLEKLDICEYTVMINDENDDLEREMAFYNQSIQALHSGRKRLAALNIPLKRPADYFCENLKSDSHMAKIKDRLILETKKIEAFEKRKNRDFNKKYNKQVNELRKQEKSQERKTQSSKDLDKFKDSGADNEHKRGKSGADNEHKRGKSSESNDRIAPTKGKKRLNMDKKYGVGGRDKKRAKLNDKKSLNDLTEFNPRGGKFVRRPKAGAKKVPNRPGKAARDMKRQKK